MKNQHTNIKDKKKNDHINKMEEDDGDFITQTQTQHKDSIMSRFEYWWLVLFEWDVNQERPFQIYLKHFS